MGGIIKKKTTFTRRPIHPLPQSPHPHHRRHHHLCGNKNMKNILFKNVLFYRGIQAPLRIFINK